jgi:outer membrane protein
MLRAPVCMTQSKILLACLILLVVPIKVSAQIDSIVTARHVRVYTLQEAIDTALKNDLKLLSLNTEILGTTNVGKIGALRSYPIIGYRGSINYAPNSPRFGYDPAITNGGDVTAQVTAEKVLYDGGRLAFAAQQNNLDLTHLQKEIEIEKADVVRAVTEAYIQVVRTGAEVDLDSSIFYESVRIRDLVRRLQAGGALGETDLLAALSDVNRSQLQLAQANTSEVIARYTLAIAMGEPADTLVTAIENIDSLTAITGTVGPLADSAMRLERALGLIELKKAEIGIQSAAAETKPTIQLTGDAGMLSSMGNLFLPASERVPFLGASVGLSINGPLFDWGANELLVQQRTAEAANVRIQNSIRIRAIETELIRLQFTLQQLRSTLALARQSIELARKSYERTTVVYAGGHASFNDLLQSERQYIDSRRMVLQILSDISNSQAQLGRLNAH